MGVCTSACSWRIFTSGEEKSKARGVQFGGLHFDRSDRCLLRQHLGKWPMGNDGSGLSSISELNITIVNYSLKDQHFDIPLGYVITSTDLSPNTGLESITASWMQQQCVPAPKRFSAKHASCHAGRPAGLAAQANSLITPNERVRYHAFLLITEEMILQSKLASKSNVVLIMIIWLLARGHASYFLHSLS